MLLYPGGGPGGGAFPLFLRPHPWELAIQKQQNANAWGLAR